MDQSVLNFLLWLKELHKQAIKKHSKCLCPNCNAPATFSHVFSRKHILQPICPNSEIYLFEPRDMIFMLEDDMLRYKTRGLRKAFGFYGFCNNHDKSLFSDIEPSIGFVNWKEKRNQYLLSYRSLCREVFVNRVMHDVFNHLLLFSESDNPNYKFNIWYRLSNIKAAYNDLKHYKDLLERGVFGNDYSEIDFYYVELPFQFELCVSAPFHVDDGRGPCFKYDYQEVNIVNVFPYYGKTIILIGYSKKFDNKWLNNILPKFTSSSPNEVNSAFTDLIYRAELNAISPTLFEKLDTELVNAYYKSFREESDNYGIEIETVQNLFSLHLSELMSKTDHKNT